VVGNNNIECVNFFINMVTTKIKSIGNFDICNEIKKDVTLRYVFIKMFTGNWPNNIKDVLIDLEPYYHRRLEFFIDHGCLLCNYFSKL